MSSCTKFREILCTLYLVSLVVTSCKTILQYNHQGTGVDAVKLQNISITTRKFMMPFYSHTHFLLSPLNPHPLAITNLFSKKTLSFQEWCTDGIMQNITFQNWLFPPQQNSLEIVQEFAYIKSLFLFIEE